jgi:putative ATP-dependent endonuclease of the OLD family
VYLSKIEIENFRGIQHTSIEFDPDITVLVGENNTGKTSILEALRLCLDAVKSDRTCGFSEYDFYRDETRGWRKKPSRFLNEMGLLNG